MAHFNHPKRKEDPLNAYLEGELVDSLWLDMDETKKFSDLFEYMKVNGKGAFGIVIKAVDKRNTEIRAVKILKTDTTNPTKVNKLLEEANILTGMDHPNIVKLYEVFHSKKYIFLIMDQLNGGTLSSITTKRKALKDEECSHIIKSVLNGLSFIHMRNYIHRDLKPDNIMFGKNGDPSSIKIVDFGLGVKFNITDGSLINDCSGTLLYMPPEQANSAYYGNLVDIWACGIILYILLTGKHPIYSKKDTKETFLKKLNNPIWIFPEYFSPLAVNFFQNLCCVDITKRYDALLALRHPWITRNLNDPIPHTLGGEIRNKEINNALRSISLIYEFCYSVAHKSVLSKYKEYKESLNSEKEIDRMNHTIGSKFRSNSLSHGNGLKECKTMMQFLTITPKYKMTKVRH